MTPTPFDPHLVINYNLRHVDAALWARFKEICARDRMSINAKIKELVKGVVERAEREGLK